MTESFIIFINSNCIIKLYIITESPVKDYITRNKTIFQTWANSFVLMRYGLNSTHLILAAGMNKHNIIKNMHINYILKHF